MMDFHPASNLFPLMAGEDFEALISDIAEHGQQEAIWLHPDGSILDGRNRWRACEVLGIVPKYRTYTGAPSTEALVSFVVSLNRVRRHLNSGQLAFVALEVEKVLAEAARERQIILAGTRKPADDLGEKFPQGRAPKSTEQAASIMGTNAHYVSDAKRIAADAPDLAKQVQDGTLSISQAKREVVRRERIENPRVAQKFPVGVYSVLYADPPWRYDFSKSPTRDIENQYPTMELEDILALPVCDMAAADAVLFLWTTSPKLPQGLQVVEAWGFAYKTCMVWDKERMGMGYYARQQHELLLIATRGALPVPEPENRPPSVLRVRRDNEHSAKPLEFYGLIERMYPGLPMIELFARKKRDGWDTWGNEV